MTLSKFSTLLFSSLCTAILREIEQRIGRKETNRSSHPTREGIVSRKFVILFRSSVLYPLYNCLMRVVQENDNRIGKNENHAYRLQNRVLKTQP